MTTRGDFHVHLCYLHPLHDPSQPSGLTSLTSAADSPITALLTPDEFQWSKFKLGRFAKCFYVGVAAALFMAIVFTVQRSFPQIIGFPGNDSKVFNAVDERVYPLNLSDSIYDLHGRLRYKDSPVTCGLPIL